MARKFVSIWFPYIATDLMTRHSPAWQDTPLALFIESDSKLVISAVNSAAELEGIMVGMTVTDARAILNDLKVLPYKQNKQLASLKALTRLMERMTPITSITGIDSIFLDMTGGTHLFGGEQAFIERLTNWLNKLGISARIALAETPGAAWALSHYGKTGTIVEQGKLKEAISSLPVSALRITAETSIKLKRVGITRIQDLINLPRQALIKRFGMQLTERLDQALGNATELIVPEIIRAPLLVRSTFEEPICEREALESALSHLLEKLIFRLTASGISATLLDLNVKKVNGVHQKLSVGIANPSQEKTRFCRLFQEKLGIIDPGFGIETITLFAAKTETLNYRQRDILGGDVVSEALEKLVDTLGNRVGFNAVQRFKPAKSWKPGCDFYRAPIKSDTTNNDDWPTPPGLRPITLLSEPIPIKVVASRNFLEAPTIIGRGSSLRRIFYAAGPERILPEWWEEDPKWPCYRDYWRVEDEVGERLWLYRQKDTWFLHGFFA
jgi:protein ImuB